MLNSLYWNEKNSLTQCIVEQQKWTSK